MFGEEVEETIFPGEELAEQAEHHQSIQLSIVTQLSYCTCTLGESSDAVENNGFPTADWAQTGRAIRYTHKGGQRRMPFRLP
ncbi:hypothetical protein [Sinorhizobium medicae]|uniref:hypothetical protein n=1 Tax=Sinorhizobium medicae TaxID=110321 RepID=UPI002B1BDF8D|nr:hypothetical protein [Sinorhizobium medicae]